MSDSHKINGEHTNLNADTTFQNDDLFGDAFSSNTASIVVDNELDTNLHSNKLINHEDSGDDLLFIKECLPKNFQIFQNDIKKDVNNISHENNHIDNQYDASNSNQNNPEYIQPSYDVLQNSFLPPNPLHDIFSDMPSILLSSTNDNLDNEIADDDDYNEEDIDVIFQGVLPKKDNNLTKNVSSPKLDKPISLPTLHSLPNLTPSHNDNLNIQLHSNHIAKLSDNYMNIVHNSVIKQNINTQPISNYTSSTKINTISQQRPYVDNHISEGDTRSNIIDDEDEDDEGDDHTKRLSTYSEYKPMKFMFGKPHPDQVVETSSMAVVEPPDLTYNLQIVNEVLVSGSLSSLQLEAIAYACQRHETFLESGERAAFFIGDGPGVGKGRIIAGIIHENKLKGREKALWLSVSSDLRFDAIRDLADVQCNLNVIPLNKISYNEYISDYEGYADDGVLFCTYSSLIGVCNSANATFRTRLEQIVQWCDSDFDGVLIFDECHKAKNLLPSAGGKSTKTALTVLELQQKLPNARIVYCSATGATEPKNLGYMYRLGLWGPGTPFNQLTDFIRAVEKRGVGGMEIVAMDMKLRGMYIARQLSFQGVTFQVKEVELDPTFKIMYNKSVSLWKKILLYCEKAIAMCGVSGKSSTYFWAKFWSYHQRFFKYLCIASKVKTVVDLTKKALKDGKCVIIGLQSTGESHISENDCNLERIVSTASGVLTALVEKSFPIPIDFESSEKNIKQSNNLYGNEKMKRTIHCIDRSESDMKDEFVDVDEDIIVVDDDDNDDNVDLSFIHSNNHVQDHSVLKKAKYSVVDNDNNSYRRDSIDPVNVKQSDILKAAGLPLCKYSWGISTNTTKIAAMEDLNLSATQMCLRWRQELLDEIEKISSELPVNTLDDLIDKLGGVDKVAEMTGRKGRILRLYNNSFAYRSRSDDELPLEYVNISERTKFMNDEKLVAIISEAASAGISLQADRRCANRRKRVHITLELPWSADKAVQQFGRSHRSNQLYPPEYIFVISELAGEKRFASSVAKRLESLGALTHGDRRASETRDLSQFNFENKYGRLALHYMLNCLNNNHLPSSITYPKYHSNRNFVEDALVAMKDSGLSVLLKSSNIEPSYGITSSLCHSTATSVNSNSSSKSTTKISRFLNRLLGIEVDLQNAIFSFYTSILEMIIKEQKKYGKFDSGILDWGVTGEKVSINDQKKYTIHSKSSDSIVEICQIYIERGTNWLEIADISKTYTDENEGFYAIDAYKHQRSVIFIKKAYTTTYSNVDNVNSSQDNVINAPEQRYSSIRPNLGESAKLETIDNIKKRYSKIDSNIAKILWNTQYESSLDHCTHLFRWGKCAALSRHGQCDHGRRRKVVYILSGAIFGIWNIIEMTFGESQIRIVRVSTSDGSRKVGIIIPYHLVDTIKSKLHAAGISSLKNMMTANNIS